MKRVTLALLIVSGLGATASAAPAQTHQSSVLNADHLQPRRLEDIDGFAALFVHDHYYPKAEGTQAP